MKFATFGVAAILLSTGLASTAMAANDDTASATCAEARLTGLQQRLVAKADQGVDSLRQYVWITRSIHGLYMPDVGDWLDARRAARANCAVAAAQQPDPVQ